MIKYVSTLAFTPDKHYVLLVKKKRGPEFLIGKWTAVGGNVEDSELLVEAAKRELKEEADVVPEYIKSIALLKRGGSECMMYVALMNEDEHYQALTDEEVCLLDVAGIMVGEMDREVADDTKALIAMALYSLDGGKMFFEGRQE